MSTEQKLWEAIDRNKILLAEIKGLKAEKTMLLRAALGVYGYYSGEFNDQLDRLYAAIKTCQEGKE